MEGVMITLTFKMDDIDASMMTDNHIDVASTAGSEAMLKMMRSISTNFNR